MINLHNNRIRTLTAAMLSCSALMGATSAFAQEAAEPAADDGIIIVTAQKRSQNLQDVPVAIKAMGTEKLDELQVNELQDAVKFLPSVTIQTSSPGFSQVYFRGVASGENANHSASLPTVGTYLDEMPITTIQGALDIHAYDLARVEALAGPQGTLYGASSMAGTIKMVTNAPDYSGNYGSADAELNGVAHGGNGGTLEGMYNLGLSDHAALRVVGWYRKDAGYIDNVHGKRIFPSSGIVQDNKALVEKDYNDVETIGGRMALGIELNDNWTMRQTVIGQTQKVNGSFAQERSKLGNPELSTIQYNPEKSKDSWLQAAMTIEGKVGDWDVVATGGQLGRKDSVETDYSDYSYFYDKLAGYGAYFVDNAGKMVSPNQYIQGHDKYRRTFGEIRWSSPQDKPLRYIGGMFYQKQTHEITQDYIIDGISDKIKAPGTVSDIWYTRQNRIDRDLAFFGELAYDITSKLSVTGGARSYKYKNSLAGFFGFSNPGYSSNPSYKCQGPATVPGAPCDNVNKSTSDNGAIYKLNATYKMNDDIMIYSTWSQGFRPGGINRRGSLPPYSPDTLDNYEFGWKTRSGDITFNGAVYQENWSNIQLSFIGLNGLTEIRNAGNARIRGLEADVNYRADGLTLTLSGSLNDAVMVTPFCKMVDPTYTCKKPADNEKLAPAGARLPITAKFKGNYIARYEFMVGDWKAHVQGALSYVGSRKSDLRTIEGGIKGNFPAYTTADLSFGLKRDAMRLEIYATNLTDTRGIINSGLQCIEGTCGDPDGKTAAGGTFYESVIRPRIVGVKVGIDF